MISHSQINKLISNYYEAITFIIGQKQINEKNLFTLYSILTTDIENDLIEEKSYYRKNKVFIGNDQGANHEDISKLVENLFNFLNNSQDVHIQTKAIIAHYAFENIHPYYDFNGRMGRLLHLWILINYDIKEFWKLTFLSEAVYAYKAKFDNLFDKILKSKKQKANIDLTFFVGNFYDILIDHTKAYIQMKKIVNEFTTKPSRHIRLFIIDLLCITGAGGKWYDMAEFKKRYPDYSTSLYGKVLNEIRLSKAFDMRNSKPVQFRLKNV